MWMVWVLAGLGAWLVVSLLAGVVIGRSIRLGGQPLELEECAVERRSYSLGAVVLASRP
jgi:hypothetical protein